jgi:hypothetical protein
MPLPVKPRPVRRSQNQLTAALADQPAEQEKDDDDNHEKA